MKKKTKASSPELTEGLLQDEGLVQEYVEYIRSKVKKNHEGYYCCETSDHAFKCWEQTEQFCKEKGLDADTFIYEFALSFGCESNVANGFDLDAFSKKNKGSRKER